MNMQSTELGFGFRSIGRGLKKVGKGVVKANVYAIKLQAKLLLLPLKYLVKAAVKLGRTLCKAPPQLLELAATQANVDPKFIPLFCTAVRENKIGIGSVKRMLPPALKIASKMAAAGMFPPIVPVLSVVKHIPYVNRFAGSDLGSYASDLHKIRPAVDTMEMIALSDHLGLLGDADAAALGLSEEDRAVMQGYLAAAATDSSSTSWTPWVAIAAMLGLGFFLGRRK
jgi:LPXTG-motif cell wall-anchored protein